MHIADIKEHFDKIPYAGCWIWRGSDTKGYGVGYTKHKMRYVHRVMYENKYGKIPEGLHVLHKCDTPLCGRPDHLFLGTNADNVADCISKGRNNKGEKNGGAKLKEQGVLDIRVLLKDGLSQYEIAEQYGVSQTHISDIKNGHKWGWLQEGVS